MAAATGKASLVALDITPDLTSLSVQNSVGWRFFVNETIRVTSMLYFDDTGDGLKDHHPVGFILDTPEQPLIFETIVDSTDPLVGTAPWSEHVVLGPTLLAGQTYWVIAVTGSINALDPKDKTTFDPIALTTIPQITFIDGGWGDEFELKVPPNRDEVFFGPSFSAVPLVAAVPEPSTGIVVGAVVAALLIRRRLPGCAAGRGEPYATLAVILNGMGAKELV